MTLGEIAARLGGTVRGDGAVSIERIAAIDDVDASSLTFATDERYLRRAVQSRAAAVLTEPSLADALGEVRKPLILVSSARLGLSMLLADLEPARPRGPFRDPSAVVDPSAVIGPDVFIGPLVVVGAGARLGRRATLHPRAMFLDGCVAGDGVVLQAGAVVGSDGFGYAFLDGRFIKIPQIGNVVLGDDVEIGANTCVDRAQTGSTTIGAGTKIDNLVQIGHNVRIGKNCGFAALSGFAGSCEIGDYTVIGGISAVNGHTRVGSRVRVAGNTMVWREVPDGATISGAPAQDHREELKQQVRFRNLEKLYERVKALEQS
jgi:UDP-3-O-[3-hydroxymyristoyl] glucosamine N-acyltransferase